MNEEKSIFDSVEYSQDTDLPIEDILQQMKQPSNETKKQNDTVIDVKAEEVKEVPTIESSTLSPLDKLKEQKSTNVGGIIVSNEDLKRGEDGPKRNIVYNDDRLAELDNAVNEYDDTMKKRNAVIVTVQPQDQFQYVELIDEINSVKFDENGNAFFALVDGDGNKVEPKYCRIRKDDEKQFDYSVLGEDKYKKESNTEDSDDEDEDEEISDSKKKLVEVIIDKTGLGKDFSFTDEERSKLEEAETIRVNEVKLVDINAIRAKRSDKSFQESINEFNFTGSSTPMNFPASGFRGYLKGLSYGEYADIAIDPEHVDFDKYYKRLSIIYNKMTNITSGPFESFEDFLKHFAFTDIPLAVYGVYMATEAEEQEIGLKCGECKKSFDWKFNIRNVLKLERCSETFLEKMKELTIAPAIKFDELKNNSAVENSKVFELPESGVVVEMGIGSAYDFLYNFLPLMNEETFKAAFGDNINEIYLDNMFLLTTIRTLYVPTVEGEYVECTGYKDILDALYQSVKATEIPILAAYSAKLQNQYSIEFAFDNVVCPHCKTVTKHIRMTIDELVFQTYQRLMSTKVDLSQIQDF